jgi:hypothetical protein
MTTLTTRSWSDTSSAVAGDILDLLDELERAAAEGDSDLAESHLRSFRKGLIVAIQRAKTRRIEVATVTI